ncbi:MAG: VWA domain-containing protein [Verrucomicrobiota bacterium]
MKSQIQKLLGLKQQRGQMLLMFVLFLVVLILFLGLAIDLGFAYSTRAELSKAVDAAALAGINNLSQGTITASSYAAATFAANYGRPGRDTGSITPVTTFGTDAGNNLFISVDAATRINTFFVRILPTWKTLPVKASAQATRSKLIMSLVLDRSGSMKDDDSSGTSGAERMTPAVTNFISHFDDARDRVALVTYASTTRTDVPLSLTVGTAFKQPIINATKAIFVNNAGVEGGTFGQGGLTNALQQNNRPTVVAGENVNRVVVFFTDGKSNIVQDKFPCQTDPWNYGGYDSGDTVGFFDYNSSGQLPVCTTSGGTPSCCNGTSKFKSAINGTLKTFIRDNVTDEAEFRAIQVANDMRLANTTVFCIGLGNGVNVDFLKEVANDPTGPNHNPNRPVGVALIAPTAADLGNVFEVIAQRILLRLTR